MHDWDVQINYPACLALIGADIFQLIAARPTAVHYDRDPGHVTSYDRRVLLCIIILHLSRLDE